MGVSSLHDLHSNARTQSIPQKAEGTCLLVRQLWQAALWRFAGTSDELAGQTQVGNHMRICHWAYGITSAVQIG
jgi:hypothetical protein